MDEDLFEREMFAAALASQLAGVLDELINMADEGEEVDFYVNAREMNLNIADYLSPPGMPEERYKENVISLDRYRAIIGR